MSRLRILYLVAAPGIPVRGPSGASAHVRGITAALHSLGHQTEIVAVKETDGRGAVEHPVVPSTAVGTAGWPTWLKGSQHLREVRTARRVAHQALRSARAGPDPVDLVWERHSLFSDAGLRVARHLSVPCILEVNAPHTLERGRFEAPLDPRLGQRWERRVLTAAPVIVAVSRWLCHWLVAEVGCDPERVHLVPNGTQTGPGDRQRGRQTLGIDDDRLVLGFIGSFRPWHGTDMLPALLARFPDALLLLVGGGADRLELPDWVAAPELAHRVLALGSVPASQVGDLVAAMDVGLAPYPADAPPWFCPLKILDYRAQGTPVVATQVADCAALTGDGGSVVPQGDVDAMVAAIQAWRHRRCTPFLRDWQAVARETLACVKS